MVTHGYGSPGGVTTVVDTLRDELTATGWFVVDIVDLATSRSDPHSRRVTQPRSWAIRTLDARRAANGVHAWGANAAELEFMRYRPRRGLTRFLNQYDVIQVVCGTPAWAAAASRCSRPVVVQAATRAVWERESTYVHMPRVTRAWKFFMTALTSMTERAAIRDSDAVMVENKQLAAFVTQVGQKRVYLAPPGVNTEIFCPGASAASAPGYILSVCRLGDPRKALDRLVRAYAQLPASDRADPPPLILAGAGSLSDPVAALIDEFGLSARIQLRCNVAQQDLPALYRGASVFVQTSREEGLGLSVLEAMASGLPVVATRTAGTEETVVDGHTGWLIDQSDEQTLPERLAAALASAMSEGGRDVGAAGRQRAVEHFSSYSTTRRFVTVYGDLLRNRSDGQG